MRGGCGKSRGVAESRGATFQTRWLPAEILPGIRRYIPRAAVPESDR